MIKKEVEVNPKDLLDILKADFESAKTRRRELDEKISKWRNEYDGKPYGNESKNRSQIVSRDIKKHDEWQHPSLVEPFVSTPDIVKANPITWEDAQITPKIEVLLNTQFCRQFNRYNFMNKAIRVLSQEGTVVVRTGWEYEEDEIPVRIMEQKPNPQFTQMQMIMQQLLASGQNEQAQQLSQQLQQIPPTIEVPKIVKQVKPIKDHPTATVCRNEDIFIDPTCQDDLDKAQFIVYRYESDMSTLKSSGKYKNLDRISLEDKDSEFRSVDDSFEFKDKPRKKLIVHEYWGNYDLDKDGIAEPIVCTWVNNVIIQLEDNPFPDKKPPFIVVPFNVSPYSLYGESNAELLSDVQKVKTAIYRGFIDNMSLSNNAQKGIKKGALDKYNLQRFLSGQSFEFNSHPSDFYDGSFNELPSSVFNFLQTMNNEGESITGVPAYNSGINGKALGETSTQVRGAVDSSSTRRLNIVRNISENLVKPLLRKWLAYDAEFLSEESQIRITNDEFIWIKRDDISANIDIDLSISTSDDNQAKASELAFLLQTNGPNSDPEVMKILMTEIARLYKMPHLAKKIEEYQPQPDPVAEKLKELEVARLEAEIEFTKSRASENMVDMKLKDAKAGTEVAKARNLGSMSDNSDLDYLHKFYGINEKRQKERDEMQNRFDLDREALKALGMGKREYL